MKIIQSWDDGIVDDIKLVEILRKYEATATFNLNIQLNEQERVWGWKYGEKDVWRLGLDEMVALYDGFEIASHSLTHPCLTECSHQQLNHEVVKSRLILQKMFGQTINGFCYPFGDYNETVKNALHTAGYTHARGLSNSGYSFPPEDPFEFGPHCHFLDENFWEIHEEAVAVDSPIFFFWGHSYEILDEKMWLDFEDNISRLSSEPKNNWVNISDLFACQ